MSKEKRQWQCICGNVFETRKKLQQHHKICSMHQDLLKLGNNQYAKAKVLGLEKPAYIVSEETKKKLSEHNGSHNNEVRKKISESMKKAHAEGRAHNIGECRWNNKPSYPEQWFIDMASNEGIDQNYIKEYPFHKYSLDFAWVDKKKVIEIDGEQHQRDIKQHQRDIEKDKLLSEEGWEEIRVSWKDVCNNTKQWIQNFKNFIN